MITEEGTYYLYRHIRFDTNEVFYIGIGKKSKTGIKYKYKRAYDFTQRSKFWKRIYNKCRKNIGIEILLESNCKIFIKQKEVEFVTLYGRRNMRLGSLVNLTPGGDYPSENSFSKERRQKLRELKKGIRPSDKCLNKSRESNIIKTYQYDLQGNFIKEFQSLSEAAKSCNSVTTNISRCCKGKLHTAGGFIWKYFKTDKIEPVKTTWKAKIYKYSLEKELLAIYNNAEEAGHFEKLYYTTIQDYCRRNYSPPNSNYFFSYSNPDNIQSISIEFKKKRIYIKKEKIKIIKEKVLSKEFLAHIGVKTRVKVINLNNNDYTIYNSIEECANDIKVSRCTVSTSINKNKIIKKLNLKLEKYEN